MRGVSVAAFVTTFVLFGTACTNDADSKADSKPTSSTSATDNELNYSQSLRDELTRAGFKTSSAVGKFTPAQASQMWEAKVNDENVEIMVEDQGDGAYVGYVTYGADFRAKLSDKSYDQFRCTQEPVYASVALSPEQIMLITEALRARLVAGTAQARYSSAKKVDELDRRDSASVMCYPTAQ